MFNLEIVTNAGPIFNTVLTYFLLLIVLIGVYFPTVAAGIRRAKSYWLIFALNFVVVNAYHIPAIANDRLIMFSILMGGWFVLTIFAFLSNKQGTAPKLLPGEE